MAAQASPELQHLKALNGQLASAEAKRDKLAEEARELLRRSGHTVELTLYARDSEELGFFRQANLRSGLPWLCSAPQLCLAKLSKAGDALQVLA